MISVKNTKNLMGVSVCGDWDDLHALYDAIYNINALYANQQYTVLENDIEKNVITAEQSLPYRRDIGDIENCVLGFLYDIRHAYMGDRDYEFRENGAESMGFAISCIYEIDQDTLNRDRKKGKNGNLYYSVPVLYPWMLYYLVALNSMINPVYRDNDYNYLKEEYNLEYDDISFRRDEGLISHLIACFLECIKEVIGSKKALHINDLLEITAHNPDCSVLYTTVMCDYYCDGNKTGRPLKKNMITVLAYYMIGEIWLHDDFIKEFIPLNECRRDFNNAIDAVEKNTGKKFPAEYDIQDEMGKIIGNKSGYDDEDEEKLCKKYGSVDWDAMEW